MPRPPGGGPKYTHASKERRGRQKERRTKKERVRKVEKGTKGFEHASGQRPGEFFDSYMLNFTCYVHSFSDVLGVLSFASHTNRTFIKPCCGPHILTSLLLFVGPLAFVVVVVACWTPRCWTPRLCLSKIFNAIFTTQ